ncbi:MAG: hypothetical protein ACM3O3_07740 [Syntrophothermus sp.]|nr:hypothetical protein [Ignavibacteriaceae bacterium]
MILVYIAVGILVLTTPGIMMNFPPYIKYLFGGTILIYGLYRIVVLYTKIKQQKKYDESNEDDEE